MTAVVAVAAFASGSAAWATAASPHHHSTAAAKYPDRSVIVACYNSETGAIRLITNNQHRACTKHESILRWAVMGPAGPTGARGAQGVAGAQGTQGVQGPQGVQGVQGAQGLQGAQGVQGQSGVQGPQGVTGPTGAPGSTGTPASIQIGTVGTGQPGSSANVTNTGTPGSAVFNFTIPQGPVGATGPQGPTGPAGLSTSAYNYGQVNIVPQANTPRGTPIGAATINMPTGGFVVANATVSINTVNDQGGSEVCYLTDADGNLYRPGAVNAASVAFNLPYATMAITERIAVGPGPTTVQVRCDPDSANLAAVNLFSVTLVATS